MSGHLLAVRGIERELNFSWCNIRCIRMDRRNRVPGVCEIPGNVGTEGSEQPCESKAINSNEDSSTEAESISEHMLMK